MLTFKRTMCGLPGRDEAGDPVRSLRRTAPSGIGLLRLTALILSCKTPPTLFSFFCDGEEVPKTEASSPSNAFASALNFIGATGASSSELSPIENFHDWGKADTLRSDLWSKGALRFRFGLEGRLLRVCRDLGRAGGSKKFAPRGVGGAAEMAAIVHRVMHLRLSELKHT